MVPVVLEYENEGGRAGISLESLEEAFKDGVKLFLFSNPNNPVGCVYSYEEITGIAALAKKYEVTLIVDELYSRQVYPGIPYTHLCAQKEIPENLITILGPSKTESLSGFRLGAAFGTAEIIERMEKLQAIMALRCSGYNQAVFLTWFHEPDGWLEARVRAHKEIRDAVMEVIREVPGVSAKPTEGGSYLFVTIPELDVSLHQFIRIVRELADVIVPNLTEAAVLLGEDHSFGALTHDEAGYRSVVERLSRNGTRSVVLTGVMLHKGEIGACVFDRASGGTEFLFDTFIGKEFHGTGDVFASVLTGALVKGKTLHEAVRLPGGVRRGGAAPRLHRQRGALRRGCLSGDPACGDRAHGTASGRRTDH